VHVLGALLAAAEEDDAWAAAGLADDDDDDDWDSEADRDDPGGDGAAAPGLLAEGVGLSGRGGVFGGLEADVMDRSAAGTPVGEDPEDANDPLSGVALKEVVRRALAPVAAHDPGECWGERGEGEEGGSVGVGVGVGEGPRREPCASTGPPPELTAR